MTVITVLPHNEICPHGIVFEVKPGKLLCDALLHAGVKIEHACDGVCACSTCHVVVLEGGTSLAQPKEDEEDQLDQAWGLTPTSRLACQINIGEAPLTIQLPRYSINHARENA